MGQWVDTFSVFSSCGSHYSNQNLYFWDPSDLASNPGIAAGFMKKWADLILVIHQIKIVVHS